MIEDRRIRHQPAYGELLDTAADRTRRQSMWIAARFIIVVRPFYDNRKATKMPLWRKVILFRLDCT